VELISFFSTHIWTLVLFQSRSCFQLIRQFNDHDADDDALIDILFHHLSSLEKESILLISCTYPEIPMHSQSRPVGDEVHSHSRPVGDEVHSHSRPVGDEDGHAERNVRRKLERLPGFKHTILDSAGKATTRLKAYQLKGGMINGDNKKRNAQIVESAALASFAALENGNSTGTVRGRAGGDEEATMRKLENYLIELFPGELCVVTSFIYIRSYV
jgi:hypothetical protein